MSAKVFLRQAWILKNSVFLRAFVYNYGVFFCNKRCIDVRIFIRLLVICVVIGIIAMFPAMLNWDSYRDDIQHDFEKETGFNLIVNGGISFKMFPSPNLYLKDVRIGDFYKTKDTQVEIVRADGIKVGVGYSGYFSLFFKKVVPNSISLVKPHFNTKHIEGGEFDISKYLFKNIVA